MSVTQEQMKKLTQNLSKLHSGSQGVESGIHSTLDYIDTLSNVDTAGVKTTVSSVATKGHLREDKEIRDMSPSDLLACSPQKIISNQIALTNIMQ
ncbi:aspartyl/glutamyl-tRNA amidotransferase subunit C [Candidatus Gracilibacteria bacterium]|nr:aspartyl/glutamyl-tRNA amidotransferase subunit C [Candidatus Gracilibacteria bacterium]